MRNRGSDVDLMIVLLTPRLDVERESTAVLSKFVMLGGVDHLEEASGFFEILQSHPNPTADLPVNVHAAGVGCDRWTRSAIS